MLSTNSLASVSAQALLFVSTSAASADPFIADREYFFATCQSLNEYKSADYAGTATRDGKVRMTLSMKDGINAIFDAWQGFGDGSKERLAYVLATARRESSNSFQPLREAPRAGLDEQRRERAIGELLAKRAKLKGTAPRENYARADADGNRYYGRGLIQLTERRAYVRAAEKTGVPLVKEPDKALEPRVASEILIRGMLEGWFGRGRPLSAYLGGEKLDWFNARETVNPKSPHKAITAEYGEDLLKCLRRRP